MVLDEPFLFSVSIRDNIAYGRPDATVDEVVAAARARAGADEFIARAARGLRHGRRRARLHALGRPAPAHRHRPHAAGQPADPRARRRHRAPSTCRSSSRSTTRCAALMREPHHADHRPPALDHQPRRPRRADEDGRIVAEGTHAELLATRAALRRDPRPERRRADADEHRRRARRARRACAPTRGREPTTVARLAVPRRRRRRTRRTTDGLGRRRRSRAARRWAARSAARPAAPATGLPFAGIPRSCAGASRSSWRDEPDQRDPRAATYARSPTGCERRPASRLRRLLASAPGR